MTGCSFVVPAFARWPPSEPRLSFVRSDPPDRRAPYQAGKGSFFAFTWRTIRLPLVWAPVGRAQSWLEAHSSEVQNIGCHTILTADRRCQSRPSSCGRIESLSDSTELAKGFLVHSQQRAQLLIQRCFGHHHPAETQCEREAVPDTSSVSFYLGRAWKSFNGRFRIIALT